MSTTNIKININGPDNARFNINSIGSYESGSTVSVDCINAGFIQVTTTPDSQWNYSKEV